MFNQVKPGTVCHLVHLHSCPSARSNSASLSLVLSLSFGSASVTQQFSKHIWRGHTEISQLAWLHNIYPNKLERGGKWLPILLISHHCIQCEVLEGTYDRPGQHATCRPNASQLCNIISIWLVISREKLAGVRHLGRLSPAYNSWMLPLALQWEPDADLSGTRLSKRQCCPTRHIWAFKNLVL